MSERSAEGGELGSCMVFSDEAAGPLEPVALSSWVVSVALGEALLDAVQHVIDQSLEALAMPRFISDVEGLEALRWTVGGELGRGDRRAEAIGDGALLREERAARIDPIDVVRRDGDDRPTEVERDLGEADVPAREPDGAGALRKDEQIEARLERAAVE